MTADYDESALSPLDPEEGPSFLSGFGESVVRVEGGKLVIGLWAAEDGGVVVNGAEGAWQNVGTLVLALEDTAIFPPPEWIEEAVIGSVHFRSTVVDAEFQDHHPVTQVGLQEFVRGNANGDAAVDIADAQYIFNYLFTGGDAPNCFDAADANNDHQVNIADGIYLLAYLFSQGRIIPAPFPQCGPEENGADLLICNPPLPADACFK